MVSVVQIRLADLSDGQELVGTVFRQMLYHGAQIDIGAEYDGCASSLDASPPHLSAAQPSASGHPCHRAAAAAHAMSCARLSCAGAVQLNDRRNSAERSVCP